MQRKQQVGEYWVCVIFFARLALVVATLCWARRGASPLRIFFFLGKHVAFLPHFSCHLGFRVHCWEIFRHMVFCQFFSIFG
jgi:hypothetical protein